MSDWSPVPFVLPKLPSDEDFQTGLSELVEGFSLMAFNAVNTAFVAMNQLLNKGYDNDDIRGSLLRNEILNLNVRGIGKNTSFNSNQDAWVRMRLTQYTNVTLQFDTASASTILLPENEDMFHGTASGTFPDEITPILWPDDTYGTQPPKGAL